MSMEGVKATAKVFSVMQETRIELLGMRGKRNEVDQQNIALGQMFAEMNDAFKNKFMKIAGGDLYGKGLDASRISRYT